MTDLRPQAQQPPAAPQPAIPSPAGRPVPQYRPEPATADSITSQSAPASQPAPSTAELIARHERETKPRSNTKRNLMLAVAGLVVVIIGALLFSHNGTAKKNGPLPASITAAQITIPIYLPKSLPAGFKVSGYKVVKQDVLNYAVTNPNNDSFYVNIEPTPTGYDFSAFNKHFTSPTTYVVNIGSATAGLMNNQLICSIQTAKSWVLINTTAIKDSADMAAVAKSLQPASL